MFFTLGLVIGFGLGWYVNEKVEDLADKLNPTKWFKKGK
jgi:hypothetical protein